MAGAGGGALLGERTPGGALLAWLADDKLSSSGWNTGATCMTELVRAERNAARTMSRKTVKSICAVRMRNVGRVRNVPTSTSSSNRTTE